MSEGGYSDDFDDYEDDFEQMDEESKRNSRQGDRSRLSEHVSDSNPASTVKGQQISSTNLNYNTFDDTKKNQKHMNQFAESSTFQNQPYDDYQTVSPRYKRRSSVVSMDNDTLSMQLRHVNQIGSRRMQRLKQVKQVIKFVEEGNEIFSLAPLRPYDLYVQQVRSNHCKEKAFGTQDEQNNIGIMTDSIPWHNRGCQVPDDLGTLHTSREKSSAWRSASTLVPFLRRVSRTVELLCEEIGREAERLMRLERQTQIEFPVTSSSEESSTTGKPRRTLECTCMASISASDDPKMSNNSTKRTIRGLLIGRRVVAVASNPESASLAIAYSPAVSSDDLSHNSIYSIQDDISPEYAPYACASVMKRGTLMNQCGLILVYSTQRVLHETGLGMQGIPEPFRVCIVPETPTSIMFGPGNGIILLAGTQAGTVCVWDLREPSSFHAVTVEGINDQQTLQESKNQPSSPRYSRRNSTTSATSTTTASVHTRSFNRPVHAYGITSGLRLPTFSTDAIGVAGIGSSDVQTSAKVSVGKHECGIVRLVPLFVKSRQSNRPRTFIDPRVDTTTGIASLVEFTSAVQSDNGQDSTDTTNSINQDHVGHGGNSSHSATSFQLASIDSSGLCHIWTSIELPLPHDPYTDTVLHEDSISDIELGLRPGGRIRLVHTSKVNTIETLRYNSHTSKALQKAGKQSSQTSNYMDDLIQSFDGHVLDVCASSENPNQLFVARILGDIIHINRFAERIDPRRYLPKQVLSSVHRTQEQGNKPLEHELDVNTDMYGISSSNMFLNAIGSAITTVDSCPWKVHMLISGSANGSISLYDTRNGEPIKTWHPTSSCICSVRWSPGRRGIFLALDAKGMLHYFNLHQDTNVYVGQANIMQLAVSKLEQPFVKEATFTLETKNVESKQSKPSQLKHLQHTVVGMEFTRNGLSVFFERGVIFLRGGNEKSDIFGQDDWLSPIAIDCSNDVDPSEETTLYHTE